MTNAIILAAGQGTRLRPLTDHRPKAMVPLLGVPLIQRQVATLRRGGVLEVSVVAGYCAHCMEALGTALILNESFETTNMVASLHCAKALFDGSRDILVAYGDIVYEEKVLQAALAGRGPLSVVVDKGWEKLWSLRMENPLTDAETMKVSPSGQILELGRRPTSIQDIQGQYIGLFRVDRGFAPRFFELYEQLDPAGSYDGKTPANMFMTSYLQLLIDNGISVMSSPVENGWLEVDTVEDLERYEAASSSGSLDLICHLEA